MLFFVALDLFWSYNFLVFQSKNKFYHKDRVTAETLVEKKEGVNMWFWFSVIALICWSGSDCSLNSVAQIVPTNTVI